MILELVLERNLFVTENRTLQLEYHINDTTYTGSEGSVTLHFNVTILPVHIRFSNVTHMFTLTRRASLYAQVLLTIQSFNSIFSLLLSSRMAMCTLRDRHISCSWSSCFISSGRCDRFPLVPDFCRPITHLSKMGRV